MNRLIRIIRRILEILFDLLIGWLIGLLQLILELIARADRHQRLINQGPVNAHCQIIPPHIYKRPDPLIYDQYYLMSLGYSVTWDNPDIQLLLNGLPVSSRALQPDTEYEVRATIHNGSTEAPAVGMPVNFSYLTFGIGTVSSAIGTIVVDLPVNGAPVPPTIAVINWRTPVTPGHYCLQVELIWADDANPYNNLGQENTDVGLAHSPAVFEFPIRNRNVVTETIMLQADGYAIPAPPDCEEIIKERPKGDARRWQDMNDAERHEQYRARCETLARRHARGLFPIPTGWNVVIEPSAFNLGQMPRK